jgi:hypothetical protein
LKVFVCPFSFIKESSIFSQGPGDAGRNYFPASVQSEDNSLQKFEHSANIERCVTVPVSLHFVLIPSVKGTVAPV